MKRKIIGILICMLLTTTATTTLVSSKQTENIAGNILQGVIDQQQPNYDDVYWLTPPGDHWQSFTNKGHILEKIQLHIGCWFGGSDDLTLYIRESPTGPSLTQVTYQVSDLPFEHQDWFIFDVPDVKLKANKMYYIVLEINPGDEYGWSGAHGDPYPLGGSSHPDADWDCAFATIVDRSKTSEVVGMNSGSTPIGPTLEWIEQTKLLASDGAANDNFSHSVSLYGEYALIGAYMDDDQGEDSGSAYIYKRNGSHWSQETKLTASDGTAGDWFGHSVSLYGDYALIGAYRNDDDGEDSGSAYVFKHDGNTWVEEAILTASDGADGEYFGFSVSLNGEYALIGAWGDRGPDDWGYGAAYVFKQDGTTWNEQAKLVASDRTKYDYFGNAVSLDGDYALVGAFWKSDDGNHSGSAYIFKRGGFSWIEETKLSASNAAEGDFFGHSVSLSGDYALIGAPDNHDDFGYAYIFKRDGTDWNQEQYFTASDVELGDAFGISVSLDGDTALIGSYGADEPEDAGSAYIFTNDGTTWNEEVKIDASDEAAYHHYGSSVSLDGEYALIGAPWDDENGEYSGSVYVFKLYSVPLVFLLGLISNVEDYGEEFMKFNPTVLFMFPSTKLLHTQGTIVIKNGYLGILNEPLIFTIGRAVIIT